MVDICLTVDVEDFFFPRPGFDAVFARQGSREYGIGLIMSLLEAQGAAGTFFVDVFNRETLTEKILAQACCAIVARGHEVGLHTHPEFPTGVRGYGMSQVMASHPLQRQRELIATGKGYLRTWTGSDPVTHRAGGYGANSDTLRALASEGFRSDSSHYYGYPHCPLALEFPYPNACFDAHGIREIPISVTYNRFGFPLPGGRWVGLGLPMKIDLDWLDIEALKKQINACSALKGAPIILFLHSYSLLDLERGLQPSQRNIRRLTDLLLWLARRTDVQFATVSQAAARVRVATRATGALPACHFNVLADPLRWLSFGRSALSVERLRKLLRIARTHAP